MCQTIGHAKLFETECGAVAGPVCDRQRRAGRQFQDFSGFAAVAGKSVQQHQRDCAVQHAASASSGGLLGGLVGGVLNLVGGVLNTVFSLIPAVSATVHPADVIASIEPVERGVHFAGSVAERFFGLFRGRGECAAGLEFRMGRARRGRSGDRQRNLCASRFERWRIPIRAGSSTGRVLSAVRWLTTSDTVRMWPGSWPGTAASSIQAGRVPDLQGNRSECESAGSARAGQQRREQRQRGDRGHRESGAAQATATTCA